MKTVGALGLALVVCTNAWGAYGPGSTGTSRLSTPANARAQAMSETLTPVADDSGAILYNPAGLPQAGRFEATASIARGFWIAGIDRYIYEATLAFPIGSRVGMGFGINSNQFDLGTFSSVDSYGSFISSGTATQSNNTGVFGIGVALGSAKSLLLGAGARFYMDTIDLMGYSEARSGLGGILSFIYKADVSQSGSQIRAGVAIEDIGASLDTYELPMNMRLGVAYYSPDNLAVAIKFQRNNLNKAIASTDDITGGNVFGLGVEKWLFNGIWALRAGIDLFPSSVPGESFNTKESIGTGVRVGPVGLDYAFSARSFQDLGEVYFHHFTVSALIGEKRSAKVAEKEQNKREGNRGERQARVQRKPRDPNAPRVNIAVAELGSENVPAGDAAVIANILRGELVKSDAFTVVEKQNMDKILTEQAFQKSGCTTEECAVKLGRVLNVQRIVVGSFGKLMGRYFINIRMVNVETGKVDYADRARGDTVDEIENGIVDIADRLVEEGSN